jgi:hypothetical protein
MVDGPARQPRMLRFLRTDYTMNTRKMDGARTLSGVGGYREEPAIELWIAPPGGAPPMATPTVAPEDVKPPSR